MRNARKRLLRRCPEPLSAWAKIAMRKHRAIPTDMHATIAMAREICKPARGVTVADAFAGDGGHYWTGGAHSVILALSWARSCAEEVATMREPYLFAAVVDAGWRSRHDVGSGPWYEAVERAWHLEAKRLSREFAKVTEEDGNG